MSAARVHFGLLTGPRCGIRNWMAITGTEADVTCKRCLDLLNGTYHVGTRRIDVKPCGTPAAYRRHLRRGDPPCPQCRDAETLRQAERYREDPRWQSVHASHGGKPRCGAVNPHAIAGPGQEVTCKRCQAYAEEAGVKR